MKFKIKWTWKIWLLVIMLALSLLAIFAGGNLFQKGVSISSVTSNSTAAMQGFKAGQIITSVNGQPIENTSDYANIIESHFSNNQTVKLTFGTDNGSVVYYSDVPPQIVVSDLSPTNLKTGLDLSGGARALVQAENHTLSSENASLIATMISQRLNVYGLEDIQVAPIQDLSGNNYISIEIAGATPSDLESLISQQGKFEAKIGNQTVFQGENGDIASVARSGQQAGIQSCNQQSDGSYVCSFQFAVYLSQTAAERFANITAGIPVSGQYLTKTIDLYLDGQEIENLSISKDLRGQVQTQISIQGSGNPASTSIDASHNAQNQMNKLQTILETGSLPYKLEIVKLDTISPTLGKDFSKSILLAAIVAILAVSIVVFIRYKKPKASLALLLTSTSEIIIILGIAAVINWNLDLPSIAGILATIGTGIDAQIIILDEARGKFLSLKQRIKRAFSIIVGSYFTSFVALIPLYSVAAGLFKGFAFTTIIGITIGVLITRPAFADIINLVEKE